jgi:hypothetical protein
VSDRKPLAKVFEGDQRIVTEMTNKIAEAMLTSFDVIICRPLTGLNVHNLAIANPPAVKHTKP